MKSNAEKVYMTNSRGQGPVLSSSSREEASIIWMLNWQDLLAAHGK